MHWRIAFQVAATYVGAVMGAGFASGQEIQQFFIRFGKSGLIGIIISSGLFALLGWVMLDLQDKWKVSNYSEFFQHLFGIRWGRRADILVTGLLFVGMMAMLAGSGAVFNEYFGFTRWLGIIITMIFVLLALWYKGEGVLWINTLLIPLKFVFCLGIALAVIFFASSGDGEGIKIMPNPLMKHWAFSAILYVSFNLTLAMVVFASLGSKIQKRGARLGAVAGGVALGVFALAIGMALLNFPEIIGFEIPMVAVAAKLGEWAAFFYVVVLWLAMVTAAVGNGFSLLSRMVSTGKINYYQSVLILSILVVPMAGLKFSRIVSIVYPIFGYIGLAFFPAIIYAWLINKKAKI